MKPREPPEPARFWRQGQKCRRLQLIWQREPRQEFDDPLLRLGDDAILPLYLKSHSQGEYVFDHAWAEALERAGGDYYPKLQAAVPFIGQLNHHPRWENVYRTLTISLSTHDIGDRVSALDFELATYFDELSTRFNETKK